MANTETNLEKIERIQGYYANESSECFPPVDLYSWYITGDEGLTRSYDGATVRKFETKRAALNYLLCHKAKKCADTLYHPVDSFTGKVNSRKTIGKGEELWFHGYAPLNEKSLALITKKYA
jgi:hypothetical protein